MHHRPLPRSPRRGVVVTLVAAVAVATLAACSGGSSSPRSTRHTTTTKPRTPRTTTTTAPPATTTSTTTTTVPTTTVPPTPSTTVPPTVGAGCGAATGPITSAVLGGDLGTTPIASYDVTDCRQSKSQPIWAAVTLAPKPGQTVGRMTVVLERLGSIWVVHSYAFGPTGCDAPAPVRSELRLGC